MEVDIFGEFWQQISLSDFKRIVKLVLEKEVKGLQSSVTDYAYDFYGSVSFNEPGDIEKIECWYFQTKLYRNSRISLNGVKAALYAFNHLSKLSTNKHVLCLITNDNLTSVVAQFVESHAELRVWDRIIVEKLIMKYAVAINELPLIVAKKLVIPNHFPQIIPASVSLLSRSEQFKSMLEKCPPGKQYFAQYEKIGIAIWQYLFSASLGKAIPQSTTEDGTERRDVLFKIKSQKPLWARIARSFDSTFVIVDFKNYKAPIPGPTLMEVQKYANKALGRFIIVVSRNGRGSNVIKAQIRTYRDNNTMILIVSDEILFRMIQRRERGEEPEDELEDLLDEIAIKF